MELKDIVVSCSPCSGTGIEKVNVSGEGDEVVYQEITCRTCGGEKVISTMSLSDEFISFVTDLNDKVNDIIAEQAAQRVDLTNALDAIWNKVKDL